MHSLFETESSNEIVDRIAALYKDTKPAWGKMTVAQMLHHCQFPLKIALQLPHPKVSGNFLVRLLFKKSLYNDQPWRKNLPTPPSFRVDSQKDFEEEKAALLPLVHDFGALQHKKEWEPHPAFGKFTPEQWGKMQYKHLDHHLRQFQV